MPVHNVSGCICAPEEKVSEKSNELCVLHRLTFPFQIAAHFHDDAEMSFAIAKRIGGGLLNSGCELELGKGRRRAEVSLERSARLHWRGKN